jgi:hypothetical protein
MSDLSDLKLDKWQQTPDFDGGRTGRRVAIILVVLIALGGFGYWLFSRRTQPAPADVRVHTEQAVAPSAPPKPVAEPGENINLPPLPETDPIVRELVARLSSHPKVAAWLTTDQLIRNFAVAVLDMAGGRTPAKHLSRVRPTGRFQAVEARSGITIDPRSYQRYDVYGDAVAALDARGAARLYATLKPRIQDAYRELGYPDGDFDRVLQQAIVELLKTPVVEGPVTLSSKTVAYEFADTRLQSLSAVQRQFLRMGPRNVKLIQAKLREIAPAIGIPAEALPR